MDFFMVSGWIFGLASFIFGIVQLMQKNKYKKQVKTIKQKQNIKKESTGYQAGGDISIQ
ncbi:MAG: hypothetical protein ACOCWG_03365 [bacterium]